MEGKKGLVHFFHGKESGPWGIKIQRLAKNAEAQDYTVESLDYSGIDSPQERLDKFLQHQAQAENLIFVGSSLGAYVAIEAAKILSPKGLFLLAPATYVDGFVRSGLPINTQHIEIVHGWRDKTITPLHSFAFAKEHQAVLSLDEENRQYTNEPLRNCEVNLHIIDGDHRLENQIDLIEIFFKLFLQKLEAASIK